MRVSEVRWRASSLLEEVLAEERLRLESVVICHLLNCHRSAHERAFDLAHQIVGEHLLWRLARDGIGDGAQILLSYSHLLGIESHVARLAMETCHKCKEAVVEFDMTRAHVRCRHLVEQCASIAR